MITNETIESFLYCEYKSHLKYNGQTGNKHPYEQMFINRKKELKNNFASELSSHKRIEVKALVDFDFQAISEKVYIVSSLIKESVFRINFDFIELNKKLGETIITPIFLIGKEKVNRKDKLVACIFASVLSSHLEFEINSCKLVYGSDLKSTKCKTTTYKEETDKLLSRIKKLVNESTPPAFYYKKYCKTCEFLERCEHELKNKGCLSLLGGIKANDIKRFNNKGIFTIEQLSFTFRPRRKRKRPQDYVRPHSFELQALALRDNKVLIHETPKLPYKEKVQIYFDFEGLSEQGFYYLIGVLIKTEKTEQSFSFWADHEEDEIKIFEQFLDKISKYSSAAYFHYGSYEITALKKMENRLDESYKEILLRLMTQSFDVFKVVSSYAYFPVYQNSLKNIATFLNFSWQTLNADGLQSVVWRKEWVKSESPAIKEKLINYNRDDCYALQKIAEFIRKWLELKDAQNTSIEGVNIERKEDFRLGRKYTTPIVLNEIKYLKKASYFDYQREHVFARDSLILRKSIKNKKSKKRNNFKVNSTVTIHASSCPKCGGRTLQKNRAISKQLIDLKFFPSGVKRNVVEYHSGQYKCSNCLFAFIPATYINL
ncbi:MAG: TM0106 family RecB-like putative nuclease, partial [Bacteroidota bacterium]